MLLKDGEKVNLKTDPEFLEKKKCIKENFGFPVVFKANPSGLSEQVKTDGNGNILSTETYMSPVRLPNMAHEKTEDGTITWQYCPVTPPKKDGEYLINHKHKNTWYDKKVFTLDEKDMEQIFFLYFKNPQFRNYFVVDDVKAEAKNKVDNKIKEAKIMSAFYGKDSVLRNDEEKLREIARAWNVANVKEKSKEQILNELETTVREQDALGVRTIDEFIDSTDLDYYTKVGAMIQKAEDLGMIKFDDRASCWFYVTSEGSLGDKLTNISAGRGDFKYEDLREYLFAEKAHISRIESLVNAKDVPKEMDINVDDLENEDYEKILAYCNKHSIASTGRGRTKKAVFEDIRKYVKGE